MSESGSAPRSRHAGSAVEPLFAWHDCPPGPVPFCAGSWIRPVTTTRFLRSLVVSFSMLCCSEFREFRSSICSGNQFRRSNLHRPWRSVLVQLHPWTASTARVTAATPPAPPPPGSGCRDICLRRSLCFCWLATLTRKQSFSGDPGLSQQQRLPSEPELFPKVQASQTARFSLFIRF